MSGYQSPGYQSPGYQADADEGEPGVIPEGSTASIEVPERPSASVVVPRPSATVEVEP